MAALSALVDRFVGDERPDGVMLDHGAVLAQAMAATWFFAGYAAIASAPPTIANETDINMSEWALIRPLFLLYLERETALQLEASRQMGVDVFGRSTAEVAMDIQTTETELAGKAFYKAIVNL